MIFLAKVIPEKLSETTLKKVVALYVSIILLTA